MACANISIHGNATDKTVVTRNDFPTTNQSVMRNPRALMSEAAPANIARPTERAPVSISITQLSKTYPIPLARLKRFFRRPQTTPVEALRDISFAVREGEIFGLIGRNGAGKTTLIKIIATLVQPTSGTVTVRGFDSVREEEQVRAQIGLASAEERSFYWRLSVAQNLMFFARLYGLTARRARDRVRELTERLEIDARQPFGELSTGNKQRMAMARALLNSPPVLLLDEPTRSLDPVAASRMRLLISSLASGEAPVTILLTSHNLAEIEELSERVAVISRGRLRALDTPANLRARHQPRERVSITVENISHERLTQIFPRDGDDTVTIAHHQAERFKITFTRASGDGLLDRYLRLLINHGARLLACHGEPATLLEVLEAYERAPEGERAKGTRG